MNTRCAHRISAPGRIRAAGDRRNAQSPSTLLTLAVFLATAAALALFAPGSALAVDPYVDDGLSAATPRPDPDLVVVREKFYGAAGVDLSAYGIGGGPHTYVQSLYFRLFVDGDLPTKDSVAALVVLPPSVTILGVITDGADLGGSGNDGVFTATDAVFGVGADPDLYSTTSRGFDDGAGASTEYVGIIDDNSMAFSLNVSFGVDDFRLIIDYGDSFPADLSFDVLGVEVTPPQGSEPLSGILVGNAGQPVVFGSGDYGEDPSLRDIPLTSTAPATSGAILPFNPQVSLFIARDPSGDTYIDSYDTALNVPLPGQFLLGTNVSNPRGITEHTSGLVYVVGQMGGFAAIDPVLHTVESVLMKDLAGDVVDVTNLPGHANLYGLRNAAEDSIDVIDPAVPRVITSFPIPGITNPQAICDGTDGRLYILNRNGKLAWIDPDGANPGLLDLAPPTGNYKGMTSRTGTSLLYLLRNTSAESAIDVFDLNTMQVSFDLAILPTPTAPASITDGPNDLLYAIGTGTFGPAGFAVVDPVSGAVVYSNEIMDFPGVNRSLTALLPQPSAVGDRGGPPSPAELRHLAWPNPFNPRVEIKYELPRAGQTMVRVLDVRGRLLRTLHQGWEPAGWNTQRWDGLDDAGRPLPSGAYFYRITAAGTEAGGKIVLVR